MRAPNRLATWTFLRRSSAWALFDRLAGVSSHTPPSSSSPAWAAVCETAGGTAPSVRDTRSVSISGNFRIMVFAGVCAESVSLLLRFTFGFLAGGNGHGRLLRVLLTLDDDLAGLAGLDQTALDELFDKCLVLLLVLVRQGILVGAHRDDNIFFSRLRIAAETDGQFRHESSRCQCVVLGSSPQSRVFLLERSRPGQPAAVAGEVER